MQRSSSSLIAGSILIGLGALALFITLSGIDLWAASWRWWPTTIIAFGALIALLPLWAMCDRWDIGGVSTPVVVRSQFHGMSRFRTGQVRMSVPENLRKGPATCACWGWFTTD